MSIDGRRVLGLIPARAGSKGIPDKNRAPLGGRPLVAWSIEAGLTSRTVDRVIVSTDDPRLGLVATSHGAEVPFLRPRKLATDETPTMPVVLHALDQIDDVDVVVLLQPTSPLRTAADIDACVELHARSGRAVVSATPADPPPQHMFIARHGRLVPLLDTLPRGRRRQELLPVLALNGAVYVASASFLRQHQTFLTRTTIPYTMPRERSIDIDDPCDLQIAEALLRAPASAAKAA